MKYLDILNNFTSNLHNLNLNYHHIYLLKLQYLNLPSGQEHIGIFEEFIPIPLSPLQDVQFYEFPIQVKQLKLQF